MTRTETLALAGWPALTQQACALISDAQFAQAGAWRLHYVRVDLPLILAQAPQAAHQNLRLWLAGQGLRSLITGAHRHDVAVQLEFARFA